MVDIVDGYLVVFIFVVVVSIIVVFIVVIFVVLIFIVAFFLMVVFDRVKIKGIRSLTGYLLEINPNLFLGKILFETREMNPKYFFAAPLTVPCNCVTDTSGRIMMHQLGLS